VQLHASHAADNICILPLQGLLGHALCEGSETSVQLFTPDDVALLVAFSPTELLTYRACQVLPWLFCVLSQMHKPRAQHGIGHSTPAQVLAHCRDGAWLAKVLYRW